MPLRLLVLSAVLLFSSQGAAQSGHTISGIVEDGTGAVIPGAKVALTRVETREVRDAMSDGSGRFSFTNLLAGEYLLTAEAEGFDAIELSLRVGRRPSEAVKLTMKVSIREEVVVPGTALEQPVSPDMNADALKFDDHLFSDLPTDGRDILAVIAKFLPGAAQGSEGASILVDGVEMKGINLPAAALRRVVINKNPYSAEFRRPGLSRIEVITHDGSRNHFHGEAAMFLQNSRFDARTPFAEGRPDLDRRVAEASFGGPLPGRRVAFILNVQRESHEESAVVNARTLDGPVVQTVAVPKRRLDVSGRLDVRPKQAQRFAARYDHIEKVRHSEGVGGLRLPEQAISSAEREHRFQLSARTFLSETFLNEFRFVLKREGQRVGGAAAGPAIVVNGAFTGGVSQTFNTTRETGMEVQEIATAFHKSHIVRFGMGLRPKFVRGSKASNFGGTFEFSSLDQLANRTPFVFRINQGQPDISFSQYEAYGFWQDELRLRSNFSVTLGLRYDWQSTIRDQNTFAPRLAFAYAPGTEKMVLRGGIGLFYDRVPDAAIQQALLYDGLKIRELVIARPSFPNPFESGEINLPPPSLVRTAPDIAAPSLLQAGIGLERQLGGDTRMAIEYHTLRGVHLLRSRNINAPQPATGQRPDSGVLNIYQIESSARMRSNALSVTLQSDIAGVFEGLAQYTFSRTIDDTSGPFALPADNYNLRPERGRADFDQRHQFNFAGMLQLPKKTTVGVVLSLASGRPFDITTGFDDNGDTVANDRPPGLTRNTGQGPGFAQLDLRLSKTVSVLRPISRGTKRSEDPAKFTVSLDAFNVVNRTNFDSFIGVQSSPFFGRANSALPGRRIQLSLKYKF